MQPWAAIVIGASAGVLYVFASKLMSNVLKVDDPLDAVAVHCFCGTWGVLCAGIFAHQPNYAAAYTDELSQDDSQGWIYGGNGKLFGCAVVYVLAIMAWVLGHMVPFFLIVRVLGLLRVDEAEERAGLDVSHHGGGAYEMGTVTNNEIANTMSRDSSSGKEMKAKEDTTNARCVLFRAILLRFALAILRHTHTQCNRQRAAGAGAHELQTDRSMYETASCLSSQQTKM